ncbi:protein FAR-RED IMPAIRED RESPONSE 1-like [Carya illinoinensis]|uniref:protein FAR-RED IMPAIRED RESPONSE 1-like n=1 Tax=Carya illinoinensis TaxID=32201 RepID=UPI001C723E34|nr:protein FAR-RED IMPAIRED RESPONSE 1-like [Carya illinoinensis]
MNAFFDRYVHSKTTLKEFVDQFDNALRKKVEVETLADFKSINQTIPCVSHFNIEKQFQSVYTNAKFKELQRELLGLMACNCLLHALRVCQLKKIKELPNVYVLDRWRKDVKRRYTLLRSSYDDHGDREDSRNYELVVKRCLKLATKIASNNEKVHAFLRVVDDFEKKCEDSIVDSTLIHTKEKADVVLDKGKKILSPNVVQGKWRPQVRGGFHPWKRWPQRKANGKILVDETGLDDNPGSQHPQFSDGVYVGTQNKFVNNGQLVEFLKPFGEGMEPCE